MKDLIAGEVVSDEKTLRRFSHDQSIYEITPLVVVFPESLEDMQKILRFASQEGIPVTPRSGGSGTAGGALGEGIVIALKREGFLGHMGECETTKNGVHVTAEAGVYHEGLQTFLKQRGQYLPADPSSAKICRIGGNIATKASGPHALKHGSIDRFVEQLEFVTARGELVNTVDEHTIPACITTPLKDLKAQILSDDPARSFLERRQNMKIASGYNLFAFLRSLPIGELVAQLLVGSIGTLGCITKAVLRTEPYQPEKATLLAFFRELSEAGDAVCAITELGVAAIEIVNAETLKVIRERVPEFKHIAESANMLLVECEGQERFDQIERVKQLLQTRRYKLAGTPVAATDPTTIEHLWTVRKQILPVIRNFSPHLRALSVVNDIGVPPGCLAECITDLQNLFNKFKMITMIYGHAGSGNLHLRPLFDISRPDLKSTIQQIADEVYDVVFRYQGTITAEHGMGRVRVPYLRREWGENLFGYMKNVKTIFDPDDVLNPGVMFSEHPITDHLRKKF